MRTSKQVLNENWRFKELNPRGGSVASNLDWMPAQVPGHVHLDLMRNGVIEDPFYRMAERSCAWVDETDWVYETTFQVEEPPAYAYLRFNGLDTIAEIILNGEELGRTDNMFIPHEFPIGGRLVKGENTLQIIFRSALRVGRDRLADWMQRCGSKPHLSEETTEEDLLPLSQRACERPGEGAGGRGLTESDTMPKSHWARWSPRSFVRKAQYMYGWDWGPELVSCGIWQSVELITVPIARILDWRYDVEFLDDEKALVKLDVEIERAPGHEETPLQFEGQIKLLRIASPDPAQWVTTYKDPRPQATAHAVPTGPGSKSLVMDILFENAAKWFPNGCHVTEGKAKPTIYACHLMLKTETLIDIEKVGLGLRTVELIREKDDDQQGESFKFRVNGRDLFIKGANWIPHDSFPSRERIVSKAAEVVPVSDVERQLTAARDAGINMLRVWGGGLYESEEFYNLCDRFGILVWQDFTYGCSYYPDKQEYAEVARLEAAAAIRRIRKHPCLALWCGNNENEEMFHDQWGKAEGVNAPRNLGEHIFHEVLPAVVAAEDPKTPYWPSSPWSGSAEINPQSDDYGDRHNWNVWHTKGVTMEGVAPGDWPNYLLDRSRFQSEFGFSSSCGLPAWEKCTDPQDRRPDSPVVKWHDKTRKGYDKYINYINLHFPRPQTLEDLVYYSQINQAEALKCGIEHWRRSKGRCWGTLFWQFNDAWPVQSWSVMDSELDPKAAYFACKRFYAPLLVSLIRVGNTVEAHLTNDLWDDVQGELIINVESFEGDLLTSEVFDGFVHANDATKAAEISVSAFKAHERDVYVSARFEPYWEVGVKQAENLMFLAEPKDLRLANPDLQVNIQGGEWNSRLLTISAKRFAPYVWWRIEGDPCPAAADNFFHLRAGESRTIEISQKFETTVIEDVRSRLRIRSL